MHVAVPEAYGSAHFGELIELLVRFGADLNARTLPPLGDTPLHLVVRLVPAQWQKLTIEALVNAGASRYAKNYVRHELSPTVLYSMSD